MFVCFKFLNLICTRASVIVSVVTLQLLRAVQVLFSPMVSGRTGGSQEKGCPGFILVNDYIFKVTLLLSKRPMPS